MQHSRLLFRMILYLFAVIIGGLPSLYANPVLDKTAEEILHEVRLSRIPQIIEDLEEKAKHSMGANRFSEARDYLKKAIVLKSAIGMKDSEGNAELLTMISLIESKLGNQCEANQLSKLARKIYHRIGVNFGAVSFEEKPNALPTAVVAKNCGETVTWLSESK
ncbi:hypothetical protein [Leptospira ilyithenensis]|uniref:Tetratricopeptide repeat protein n=1 Tax=Leptospira ilyithenensis TaxID=2484901 RepID=A0A4R9LSK7_9LEPT|nr:hypothetical protein [Leptospira ilyithenensis]TGN11653.1 hypothetical protein EHS11_06020 [Leptospira ilyithenensis]